MASYGVKYEIVIIDTYEKQELVPENISEIEDYISEMNSNGSNDAEKLVNFFRLNQADIHKSLRQADSKKINMSLALKDWGLISTEFNGANLRAYYGTVCGSEVSSWWEEFGDKSFERNIRKFLGETDVNGEIEKTLHETPDLFWYFNNGITIVADKITKNSVGGTSRDMGCFELRGFSVINGAQTISGIGKYKYKNPESNKLENVKVYVRIIEISENDKLAKSITRANNRQNRIEGIDFASQDPVQQRIKNELVLEGIEYSIMRSEEFKSSQKSFNLQEATISLATINKNVSLTVQVKSSPGKFFENLNGGIYKEIFNESVDAYYVYNAVIFTRSVDELLSRKIKEKKFKSGKTYGVLVHGNRMLTHLVAKKMQINDLLNNKDYKVEQEELLIELNSVICKTEEFIKKRYPDNYLATLFKNSTKCKELDNYIS